MVFVPLPYHAWRGSDDATAHLTVAYWPTIRLTIADQPIAHRTATHLAAANVPTADGNLQLLDLEP